MRQANSDEELDARIYALGDFGSIMNVAKRRWHSFQSGIFVHNLESLPGAKRIGLLFSQAEASLTLDPARTSDIGDIKSGDTVFSDGCGLVAPSFAKHLGKQKRIIFRGVRYTPCVWQIRSFLFIVSLRNTVR